MNIEKVYYVYYKRNGKLEFIRFNNFFSAKLYEIILKRDKMFVCRIEVPYYDFKKC